MVDAIKLPNSPHTSSIEEAQALIRRCAEPRPAGDLAKAAIRRASQRLEIPYSRTRAIWYAEARRIDAEEMDRLRRGAEKAELAQATAAIEFLTNKALTLHAALLAFSAETPGELSSSIQDKVQL